ncbi:MAG: HPr family phosphocarrier protein [Bacteroidales bacterium]|nr:HPr family phosphocarrier protein [Bacteroidales bacterium]
MVSAKVVLKAPTGLHARPAADLVKLVKGFEGSLVKIASPARSVNAASVLSLLSLGIKCGTELEISVEGGREQEALEAVISFIESIKD